MDCNHWFNPKSDVALAAQGGGEAKGLIYTYEVFLAYNAVAFLVDAIERAGSTDKDAVNAALAASEMGHVTTCPMARRRWSTARTKAAQPVNTQVQNGEIEVIYPGRVRLCRDRLPDGRLSAGRRSKRARA
jgi:branched-chain amino acid transport system substrate-binding protein